MFVLTFSDPENVKEHYSHLVGDGVDVLVADISKFHEGGGLGISLEGTQNPHGKIFFGIRCNLLGSKSDQNRISPYSINTFSSRKMKRISKKYQIGDNV